MHPRRVAPLLATLALAARVLAAAPPPVEELVRPYLVAARDDRGLRVGVLFRIAPGWHVYWKDPGEAGEATWVDLTLPEGFEAGPLRWPTPEVHAEAGGIETYGYEDEVLLFASAPAPSPEALEGPHRLAAEVEYLVCKDVCLEGAASLAGTLPAGGLQGRLNLPLFEQWERRVPRTAGAPGSPFRFRELPPEDDVREIVLEWREAPPPVVWIPPGDDAVRVSDVEVVEDPGARRTRLRLRTRVLRGLRPARDPLESLLLLERPGGAREGWVIPVPVQPPSAGGGDRG